jgi:isopentenyldiphosphate isomerase
MSQANTEGIIASPTALSGQELIEIVDENNNVLEPKYRFEMRRDKLIHRSTYAFVRTSNNYYYVQKRSSLKDYCPNYFDPCPGGVVAAGESYEFTNSREIEEEMGISGVTPIHLFTFYYEDQRIRCFGDAWEVEYDGPLKLQKEEVDSVDMMTMDEILQRADNGEKFTPDSIYACREFVKRNGCPIAHGERPIPVVLNS